MLGHCLQPLGGPGHQVKIRVEVGRGATTAQISALLQWLEPIDGAVWRIEKRQARAGPRLGTGYDVAVNVGRELSPACCSRRGR